MYAVKRVFFGGNAVEFVFHCRLKIFFSLHAAIAAEGNERKPVIGSFNGFMKQHRPHTDRKTFNVYAEKSRNKKVPEFVNKNDYT